MIPSIISRGINIILVPLYTRVLIPADYGAFDMFIVFGNLVNLTVALEVGQAVARFYPDEKDYEKRISYVSTAFWFLIFCYSVFCITALFTASWLSEIILGKSGFESYFTIALAFFWLNGLLIFLQNQFRWQFKSSSYSITGILVAFTTVAVSIWLAYYLSMGLKGILLGLISGVLAGCLYGLISLRETIRFKFDKSRLREMLKYSIPLVPSGIAVFLTLYIDRMMINHYMSLKELGLYGIGYRLSNIVGLVMVSFQLSLTPYIFANYKEKDTPLQLSVIFRIFSAFALLTFVGLSIFSREILWIMTSSEYYQASTTVIFLVPAILFSNMYIFAPGISIAKKSQVILWINVAGAVINIVLNFIFIPRFGIMGAGLAKLIGAISIFSIYMVISQKLYHVPHNWKPLVLSFLGAFVFIIFTLSLRFNLIQMLMFKLFVVMLFVGFIFITGLIRISEIQNLFNLLKQKFR